MDDELIYIPNADINAVDKKILISLYIGDLRYTNQKSIKSTQNYQIYFNLTFS